MEAMASAWTEAIGFPTPLAAREWEGLIVRRSDMKSIAKTLALLAMAATGPVLIQAQISNFRHIVIIFQENRTPDNLFQGLCGQTRSQCPTPYDVRNYGFDNKGHKIQLQKVPLGSGYIGSGYTHDGFVTMCHLDKTTNECKMDGLSSTGCGTNPVTCAFLYVDPSDVAPYITMARQYGWANFMFQTNQGPSTSAHQFIFGGTSAPSASDDAEATFVAENDKPTNPLGCLAPLDAVYLMISPQTAPGEFKLINNPLGTICFSRDTMATLLDNHNPKLSWKYYTPGNNHIWTAPILIKKICGPNQDFTECTGTEWTDSVDLNPTDVLTDIGACKLRNVIWVIPAGQNSDHPPRSTGGPSWVSSIVNKIGTSTCTDMVDGKTLTYWQDTAILITWDDWGGWYDHEPPTLLSVAQEGQGDYQYGFRVPLVVISAYTPRGYVDNARHDFGSILRFVEHNFSIPEGALNFADQRATTDLTEFFNLSHSPRTFNVIPAPLGEKFFLNDRRPMEPPDTD
jgi:phospholipase C